MAHTVFCLPETHRFSSNSLISLILFIHIYSHQNSNYKPVAWWHRRK